MAHPFIADSDLLIDYLTGQGAGGAFIRDSLLQGDAFTSAVSVYELRQGMNDSSPQWQPFQRLLEVRCLPLDRDAALQAGTIASGLAAAGTPIGMADVLIAGICRHFSLPLATRNRAHFERIEGLELVDF